MYRIELVRLNLEDISVRGCCETGRQASDRSYMSDGWLQ